MFPNPESLIKKMLIKKLDKWFNLIKERNYLKIKIKKLNL